MCCERGLCGARRVIAVVALETKHSKQTFIPPERGGLAKAEIALPGTLEASFCERANSGDGRVPLCVGQLPGRCDPLQVLPGRRRTNEGSRPLYNRVEVIILARASSGISILRPTDYPAPSSAERDRRLIGPQSGRACDD